jgi:hypothetical protein
MRFSEKSLACVIYVFGEVLANLLIVRALTQYEGAFGGMSFVAFRGHIVETCSLPICLSLCDYLWEQLILSSLNLFCKPNFFNC